MSSKSSPVRVDEALQTGQLRMTSLVIIPTGQGQILPPGDNPVDVDTPATVVEIYDNRVLTQTQDGQPVLLLGNEHSVILTGRKTPLRLSQNTIRILMNETQVNKFLIE